MANRWFCSRCGLAVMADGGRVTCGRCGNAFAVPGDASMAAGDAARPRVRAYDVWTSVLLYFFLPVGLILVWSHPTWPTGRKWTMTGVGVAALAASFVVLPLLFGVVMMLVVLVGLVGP